LKNGLLEKRPSDPKLEPPLSDMKTRFLVALAAGTFCMAVETRALEPDTANSRPARNVDGMMDNSFLIEEAYNQEPGVVQHIFTAVYGLDRLRGPDTRSLDLAFTQEWPVFSQRHQFSYTVPYQHIKTGGQSDHGLGDILLNYRYQAYFDPERLRGFAPRFSLVLPTGDAQRGFGDDTLGYQWNLPFSTAAGERWFFHANAGLTFLPHTAAGRDLLHYNLGASAIYAAKPDLHFMLECVGAWMETPGSRGAWDHQFAAILAPGVRRAFNFANDSQLVLGIAVPIGLTGPAPDLGVFLYVSFEHPFRRNK
jgi:hypothetical protein